MVGVGHAVEADSEQEKLMNKLRQMLELTKSPNEHEAATAAAMLQKFLTEYNLEMADLEAGGKARSKVDKHGLDLGKAVYIWTWKLELAKGLAQHYYCVALNPYGTNNLSFVGRPENVEALKMLFNWLVDQVKRLATEERKRRMATDIHPMRWLMSFGDGAVPVILDRLHELAEEQMKQYEGTQALVIHHATEVSDWLEENGYNRRDGKLTKRQQELNAEWEARKQADKELLERDPKAYYEKYPHRTPEAIAEMERKQTIRLNRSRAARQAAYSRGRSYRTEAAEYDKERAYGAGRDAADKVNLQPFLNKGESQEKLG